MDILLTKLPSKREESLPELLELGRSLSFKLFLELTLFKERDKLSFFSID